MEKFYTPPKQEIFDEVKSSAIEIWETYEEPYRSKKVDLVSGLGNVSSNFMYIVQMFDADNQAKLGYLLSTEAIEAIKERLGEQYLGVWRFV